MTDEELRDELVTLLLAGPRDHGDVGGVGGGAAGAPPRQARAADGRDRRGGERRVHAGGGQRDAAGAAGGADGGEGAAGAARVGGRELPRRDAGGAVDLPHQPQPERVRGPREFLPGALPERAPETFSWIPFGGGIRRCIGASFALLEMKLILRRCWRAAAPACPRAAGAGAEGSGTGGARSRSCRPPARGWYGSGAARRSELPDGAGGAPRGLVTPRPVPAGARDTVPGMEKPTR